MSDIMVRFHSWTLIIFLFIYIPLWNESLNSEGQQYSNNINNTHNHLSSKIIKHKMMMTYDNRNPGDGWDRHKYMAWLNQL